MINENESQAVFQALRDLLKPYEQQMVLKSDGDGDYYLEAPHKGQFPKQPFFGSVKVNKNYVSYHLMPVYVFPDLLEELPPELKKRMQGKSCFNFKKLSQSEISGLEELTRLGFERYRQAGLV